MTDTTTPAASANAPADASAKAWSGRFSEPVSELVKRYTASVSFDQRMAAQDIRGSLAHARMLARQGIIGTQDLVEIERGMAQIAGEIERGEFAWNLDDEDVHLNIEKRLTALVGDAGKRLHTGRSRNDQVATDIRLWLRDAIDRILGLIAEFQARLLEVAETHAGTPLPGFTHLQVAQPVTFGHHLMAYFEMSRRDAERFADCRKRVNRLPLGSAALAGTSYPIDREFVASELGFDEVCYNSLDAVSDRDFAIEFCAASALLMTHLSRLSEELILWMSPRVGFIDLADRFCTGSSIMPQKKNPDVPELVRGKTGRVNGSLVALLTLMKGQPLAYNKDNQEDKEPLFDTADTVIDTLRIYADMIGGIRVKAEAMRGALSQGYATATDLADYLVKKGLPFRDAHEAVALAVRAAEVKGCDLPQFTLDELRIAMAHVPGAAERLGEDVFGVLTVEGSLASRKHIGGTAPEQVRAAVARARIGLGQG
ncbi:argininosuccinate lyase [Thauera sp.]|uniref:argininosuccinate lyase n=1 Tax=Thauera sp. TaxID=1905334 RepID=UPI001B4844F2|nr:argininosuccinate lyase [Thauera sp.]HMZ28225.1 argininosuccinate lyase [Thauera aminoaromatica]MBP6132293.1 argininosuccinate lyase [Thauera sp.]MBP7047976.1 argininosuccinate lyase [Thauera sp.]HNC66005.1 argininosuccinate lyase [Thauera aminoaromatica]HND58311.1 argininosuccinate lyase [Thauera aminoaromatica]